MSNSAPAIKLRSFLQTAPYLAMRGVSPIEFFRRLGISPNVFQNPDVWLPRAECFRIGNEVAAAAQDPFGGVYVGHLTEIRSLGTWGKLILGARTVAEVCARAEAYATLIHGGGEVRIVTEGQTTRMIHRFTGHHGADPRQFIFGTLAVLRKLPLMAGEPSAIRVHLKASRARGDDALEECLGPNIEMGAEYNMIEFDRSLLEMPLLPQMDEAWRATEAIRSTVDTAGMLIDRISDQELLKLKAIAGAMGMSARTLQRRLNYCGVVFEDLLDETRRSEALRLISQGEHTATEIAYGVGYSDPAHFTRAFKRWTGIAPSRFPIASNG